jgi:hypothetical protein
MNRYGYDGQLGCAAITFTSSSGSGSGMDSEKSDAQEQETVRELEKWTTTNANGALPAYAVPRFLRVLVNGRQELDGGNNDSDTGADRVSLIMKKLKTGLRQEGELPVHCSADLLVIGFTDSVLCTARLFVTSEQQRQDVLDRKGGVWLCSSDGRGSPGPALR